MNEESKTRRDFIRTSTMAGAGAFLASSVGAEGLQAASANTSTKGLAARDEAGKLSTWSFDRRPVGDNDVLIDIKFCGICHSDIHQMKGHWSPQQYPQVPGHEIAGVVAAVGKNVTKFKVGDQAGVGCMVNSCLECDSCREGEEHYCDLHEPRRQCDNCGGTPHTEMQLEELLESHKSSNSIPEQVS